MPATTDEPAAWVQHTLPGRTRIDVGRAHLPAAAARALEERLRAVQGVRQVKVDRWAASVVCLHGAAVRPEALLAAAREVAATSPTAPPNGGGTSRVARQVARLFKDLDREVLRATKGGLDLPTLTTLGFLGAGALEVGLQRRLPVPPWFNLAWWGVRTFMSHEGDAIRAAEEDEGRDPDGG